MDSCISTLLLDHLSTYRGQCHQYLHSISLTGGDWRAAIWGVISLFVAGTIYYPFFKIADKKAYEEEQLAKAGGNIESIE